MKTHLTPSTTVTTHLDNQDGTAEALAPVGLGERAGRAQAVHARPRLTLASPPVWRHKLILTGTLDHRTAVELEDEVECLCEEGVTALTLDLRQLDALDAVAARAIARHGAACRRRGRDCAVLVGSPLVHDALAEAGAESLLAGADEPGVQLAGAADGSRDTATVMIKSL